MPRPTTKADLIIAANGQFLKLWNLINTLHDTENVTFDFSGNSNLKEAHWVRDKNLRDILIHLYEWHQLFLVWVKSNQNGITKPFIPEPYNWKTYGEMNVGFWQKHQDTSYHKAREFLNESHREVMSVIEAFSNDMLFTKQVFLWTGGTTLGSFCVSVTSSHYAWAIKKSSYICEQKNNRRGSYSVQIYFGSCCNSISANNGTL